MKGSEVNKFCKFSEHVENKVSKKNLIQKTINSFEQDMIQ